MWQSRYEKVFPGLKKEDVWAAWTDVNTWSKWDKDTQYSEISGPFQAGSTFTLKPKGGPKVKVELLSAEPLKIFIDVTRFPLARMYDTHEMEETPQGLKLVSIIRVEGPLSWLWRKLVAEGVAAGAPKQLDSLAEFLRRK